MRLGAETNTRWLWFITYVLLPLNVIAQIFGLFWLLDADHGGIGILFILAELGLTIATIIGLYQFKPWGWYCIMVVFGIQLIGTPLKVHAKASLRYEVTQTANSYLQSQGRSPHTTSKPSIFDFEPMLTFFLLLAIWTIPNAIYLHRRRSLFVLSPSSHYSMSSKLESPSSIGTSAPMNNVVTNMEEQAFANAQQEYEGGNIRDGLMVKVSTEEPDPQKQRLLYIRYRAQQLIWERQQNDTNANNEARSQAVMFRATQIRKSLRIAIPLFLIPIFSPIGFWVGDTLMAYMISGVLLWGLYALLLLKSGGSKIWLAIPAVCIMCHLLGPYTWWWYMQTSVFSVKELSNGSFMVMPSFAVLLMMSISAAAIPYCKVESVRISRAGRTVKD